MIANGGVSITRVAAPRAASHTFFAVYLLGALAGAFGLLFGVTWLVPLSYFASTCAWPVLFGSYVASLTPVWSPGSVEVRDKEIVVTLARGKARRVPRSEIVGALVVPRGAMHAAEIETRRGDRYAVTFTDPADARRLVAGLGYGPGGARVRTRLAKPTRRLLHPLLGVVAWTVGFLFVVLASVAAREHGGGELEALLYLGVRPLVDVAVYLVLRRLARGPEVVVGEDAVVVERGLGRKVHPRATADAAALPLAGLAVDAERAEAVRRLAAERYVASAATDEALAAFARAGRTLAEWRDDLRAKMEQGGYRSAATSVDTAAAVLRSPRATPEQRVGAAVALRVAGEPPARIRVAADASASDPLRDALEAVAEDEGDARLERALRRIC